MTVYLGIDWSEQKHSVCFLNPAGAILQQFAIEHSLDGFLELDQALQALGIPAEEVVIGLETAHSMLIDFFLDRGYSQIYVLPPGQVHANQGRYSSAKAQDDPRDARLIADMLRTDQGRYRPWHPDQPLTRQVQVGGRYVLYLSRMIRRQTNHLRAVLLRYYPAALGLFSKLDSPLALAFLRAYPTPQPASQLSPRAFQEFLRQQRYPQPNRWSGLYEKLHGPYPQAHPDTVALYQTQVPQLAEQLALFVCQKRQALRQLHDLFVQHPDASLYTALPGAGEFLAPALLAELGDDRARYPTPQILQAVAGTCPVTIRSGKQRTIRFRRACDRQFRYIATLWAGMALKQAPWAQTYFDQLLRRGLSRTDAIRRVANRLLAILWKLWQTRTPYQESVHLQQRLARAKPRA